jgi:hypothetical protein
VEHEAYCPGCRRGAHRAALVRAGEVAAGFFFSTEIFSAEKDDKELAEAAHFLAHLPARR